MLTQVNSISYKVYDEKQKDDSGIEYMNIHWYRKLAMWTLMGGVILCAYLAYQEIDKGSAANVTLIFYLVVFLIALSSFLMIGVIVYSLTIQIPVMNDREELEKRITECLTNLNARVKKTVGPSKRWPKWTLGERLYYLTVTLSD